MDDMKHRGEDSFALFTEEEAGVLLALLFAGLVLLDLVTQAYRFVVG